jgi:hypothetical protein
MCLGVPLGGERCSSWHVSVNERYKIRLGQKGADKPKVEIVGTALYETIIDLTGILLYP